MKMPHHQVSLHSQNPWRSLHLWRKYQSRLLWPVVQKADPDQWKLAVSNQSVAVSRILFARKADAPESNVYETTVEGCHHQLGQKYFVGSPPPEYPCQNWNNQSGCPAPNVVVRMHTSQSVVNRGLIGRVCDPRYWLWAMSQSSVRQRQPARSSWSLRRHQGCSNENVKEITVELRHKMKNQVSNGLWGSKRQQMNQRKQQSG